MINKAVKGLFCIAVLSCIMGCHGPVMTPCVYDEAQIGDCIEEVTSCAGQPYCVAYEENGLREYVYISRSEVVPNIHQHKNWVFIVDDTGCIVDKYICDDERVETLYMMRQDDFDRMP